MEAQVPEEPTIRVASADRVGNSDYRNWCFQDVHEDCDFSRQRNKQLVNLLLKGNKPERSNNRLLIKELTDRGVTAITAQQLVEDASLGQDRIRHKFEILDWIKARDPQEYPKRPGGWLFKAIKEEWQPPARFQMRQEREEQAHAIAEELASRVQAKKLAESKENENLANDRKLDDA